MKSLRPYLMRALVDWIVDSDQTPYLIIDCEVPGGNVPEKYAVDGKLVLNVSPYATRNLQVGDEEVSVDCRFRGRPFHVVAPLRAVTAVYSKESGRGLAFGEETEPPPASPAAPSGPKLKLVK